MIRRPIAAVLGAITLAAILFAVALPFFGAAWAYVFAAAGAMGGAALGAWGQTLLLRRLDDDIAEAARVLEALAQGKAGERLYLASEGSAPAGPRFNQALGRLEERIGSLELDRARFRTIFAHLQSGVVLLDARRRVLLMNPAAERIFGVWAPEVESRYHLALTHAYELEAALDRAERGEVVQLELREAGRLLAIELLPVLGQGGGGTLLVAHDVTEERRLLEIRSQFVANVSHELRTPLTVIRGFAETLLGSKVDAERAQRFLRHIADETERLSLLVDDLLRLAAIEGGAARPARAACDLREVALAICERYRDAAAAAGIALDLEGQSARVVSDRDRIEGILVSLIDNAVKYTPEGGRVVVETGEDAAGAYVSVADNGMGIPERDLPHIFERFYRVDRARQRATGGSGLGLSIARHLALSIGAELLVESEVAKGTRFTLRLRDMSNAQDA